MRQPLGPIRFPSLGILSVKAARDAQREMSTTRPVGRVKERAAGARSDSSTEAHSAKTGKRQMDVFLTVGRGSNPSPCSQPEPQDILIILRTL